MTPDPEHDAEVAYTDALARLRFVKKAWKDAGKPILSTGSRGQESQHPLFKAIQESEVLMMKLRADVRKHHRGPNVKAVVEPSVGASPAAKLRKAG